MKRMLVAAAVVLSLTPLARPLAQGQTAAPPADPSLWTIDTSHSAAGFSVKHLLVSTVRGTLGPVKGTVWYDGKNINTIKADVTIDVAGLDTGVDNRDNHLRTPDFFDVPNHPTITFTSKRAEPGTGGHFKLIGDLTMRGVTKEVALDVEGPSPVIAQARGGSTTLRTGATATTKLNRFDYGLKWNSLIEAGGGAVVSADVNVTIDLEMTKRSAGLPPSREATVDHRSLGGGG